MDDAVSGSVRKPSIAVLLTGYKRGHVLQRQLEAIQAQTVPVEEIWLYHNRHRKHKLPDGIVGQFQRYISVFPNLGVWPRFLTCLEFSSEHVCVFDDDTVPGTRWLENCLTGMALKPGLYGTNGILFPPQGRRPYKQVGWKQSNEKLTAVDIVGHSWFFRRDWLRAYAAEPRPMREDGSHFRRCGEDYFFSYVLQRRLGLGTYVPPHPATQQSFWGSTQGRLGRDQHALWRQKGEEAAKNEFHAALRKRGWQLRCELD